MTSHPFLLAGVIPLTGRLQEGEGACLARAGRPPGLCDDEKPSFGSGLLPLCQPLVVHRKPEKDAAWRWAVFSLDHAGWRPAWSVSLYLDGRSFSKSPFPDKLRPNVCYCIATAGDFSLTSFLSNFISSLITWSLNWFINWCTRP